MSWPSASSARRLIRRTPRARRHKHTTHASMSVIVSSAATYAALSAPRARVSSRKALGGASLAELGSLVARINTPSG
eukprot:29833-Pelagococcus_subviridis.AAC.4